MQGHKHPYELYGVKYHCWKKYGHGYMRLRNAIKQSCDIYFYEMARILGVDKLSIIAKRSGQINSEIKKELHDKLDEFATHNDSLEEIFENKEQIEVSKFYEKLPKPYAIAIEEWLEDKIYYRDTEAETE